MAECSSQVQAQRGYEDRTLLQPPPHSTAPACRRKAAPLGASHKALLCEAAGRTLLASAIKTH